MADTLGSLIDKLSIVNIKLFMVQDKVHEAAVRMQSLDADTVRKLDVLNRQRNALKDEIDQTFATALANGKAQVDPSIKV